MSAQPQPTAEVEAFARLHAHAARAGWLLKRSGPGFVLSRWGRLRAARTLAEVEALLRQVGAIRA